MFVIPGIGLKLGGLGGGANPGIGGLMPIPGPPIGAPIGVGALAPGIRCPIIHGGTCCMPPCCGGYIPGCPPPIGAGIPPPPMFGGA